MNNDNSPNIDATEAIGNVPESQDPALSSNSNTTLSNPIPAAASVSSAPTRMNNHPRGRREGRGGRQGRGGRGGRGIISTPSTIPTTVTTRKGKQKKKQGNGNNNNNNPNPEGIMNKLEVITNTSQQQAQSMNNLSTRIEDLIDVLKTTMASSPANTTPHLQREIAFQGL